MSNSEKTDLGFQYFIAPKKPALIVTFVGDMDQSAIQKMNECRSEITALSSDAKFAIFNFRDVGNVNGEVIAVITQIQIDLRARGLDLRISSINPTTRDKLLKMGVIRSSELANNLKEALISLLQASKIQKAA